MPDSIIPGVSEFESLQQEIKELQKRLALLTAERDDLLYHICPALQAEYDEKIGSLERELLAAKLYLREKERILEILQARASRGRTMSVDEAKTQADREFEEYEEELRKKARDAENFHNEWRQSQWSEHDRKTREEETGTGGRGTEDKDGEDSSGQEQNTENSEGQQEDGPESSRENGTGGRSASGDDEGDGEGEDDEFAGGSGGKRLSPGERLKRLYRKIVKLLHPDMNPNPTPREKELFNMATEAYQKGDLERMEKIWEEIRLSGRDGASFTENQEDLEYLRQLLQKMLIRIRELKAEISRIHSAFPYTMKDFLEDDEAVERKQQDLKQQIQEVRDADRALQEFIDILKKKMEEEHL